MLVSSSGGLKELSETGLAWEMWNVGWILMAGGHVSRIACINNLDNRERTDEPRSEFPGCLLISLVERHTSCPTRFVMPAAMCLSANPLELWRSALLVCHKTLWHLRSWCLTKGTDVSNSWLGYNGRQYPKVASKEDKLVSDEHIPPEKDADTRK